MENVYVNINDIHICGACQSQFILIASFVAHIKVCPKRVPSTGKNDNSGNVPILHPPTSETPVLHIPDDEEEDAEMAATPADRRFPVQNAVGEALMEARQVQGLSNGCSVILPGHANGDLAQTSLNPSVAPSNSITLGTAAAPSDSSSKEVVKYSKVTVMGATKFRCTYELCAFTTQYLKDVERHYRIHTGEKPYQCWQCGKRFSRKDKLKTHQMVHKGEKPFKCLECNYATNDNSSLVKHKRIHSGERPYKCQICPYASRNASQLVVHLRTHTGDTPFHCRLCHMKFKINSDLKRHSRLHTGEKPYACTFCAYRSSIKTNLNSHMKSHVTESPLHCELCDYVTPSRKDLLAHERLHQARAYQCLECSYTASSQSALNVHHRIHSHEKPYKCVHCPFTSKQSCNVHTHIKRKHPDKIPSVQKIRKKGLKGGKTEGIKLKSSKQVCRKSFTCKVCKTEFVRLDSLRCHLRQHQAEQLLAEAQASNTTTEAHPSENLPVLVQVGPDAQPAEEVSPVSGSVDQVTVTVEPPSATSQTHTASYLPNNLQTTCNFNNINFSNTSQLGNNGGLNLVFTAAPPVAVSQPTVEMAQPPAVNVAQTSVQNEYLIPKQDILTEVLNKGVKDDPASVTCIKDGLTQPQISPQTLSTILTATPTPSTNDLGLYQLYQMPANVSFVTLPVVSSASTQSSYAGNILNSIGELDTTSLVNQTTPTLLHISNLGPSVQYVISQAPSSKLSSDTCT